VSPEPGWYPDPFDPSRDRWWNGASWTEDTQAGPQTPDPYEQARQTPEPQDGDYVSDLFDDQPYLPTYEALAEMEDDSLEPAGHMGVAPNEMGWDGSHETRGASRWKLVGVVGLALALLVGAGVAAAYFFLNGRGPQPEDLLPGDTAFMARVDFDPSLEQKANAVRLLSRLPNSGISEGTESPQDVLIDQSGQDPVFIDDAKKWIGSRFSVAVVPHNGTYAPIVVASMRDEASLDAFMSTHVPGALYAVKDGYAIISNSQSALEVVLSTQEPLSAQEDFVNSRDALGIDPLALVWLDLAQVRGLQEASSGLTASLGGLAVEPLPVFQDVDARYATSVVARLLDSPPDVSGVALLGLSAEPDALRSVVVTQGIKVGDAPALNLSAASDGLSGLPSRTLGAISVANLSGILRDFIGWTKGAQPDAYAQIVDTLAGIGISEDTLYGGLGDQISLVFLPGKSEDARPIAAIAIRNSALTLGEVEEVAENILAYAASPTGSAEGKLTADLSAVTIGEYTYLFASVDEVDFGNATANWAPLGDAPDFQSVFPDGSGGFFAGYVAPEGLSLLSGATTGESSGLNALRAVGLTVTVEEGSPGDSRTELMLSFR
jgi:hypothetical protein